MILSLLLLLQAPLAGRADPDSILPQHTPLHHDLTIVLPDTVEIGIEVVAGGDTSVSFDMQALASLMHGDRVSVRRSNDQVRFLHPRGWSYYATLRRKLRWNAGVS